MQTEIKEAIKVLVAKAKQAPAHEAMHFSQAALNLCHAAQVQAEIARMGV
jgi:hypothetical protein